MRGSTRAQTARVDPIALVQLAGRPLAITSRVLAADDPTHHRQVSVHQEM
jgi:hypothetical protein